MQIYLGEKGDFPPISSSSLSKKTWEGPSLVSSTHSLKSVHAVPSLQTFTLDGLAFPGEGPHVHPGEIVCHRVYAMPWSGNSCRQWQSGTSEMAGLRTAFRLSCHTLPLSVNSRHLLVSSWGSCPVLGLSSSPIKQNANILFFLGTKQRIFPC